MAAEAKAEVNCRDQQLRKLWQQLDLLPASKEASGFCKRVHRFLNSWCELFFVNTDFGDVILVTAGKLVAILWSRLWCQGQLYIGQLWVVMLQFAACCWHIEQILIRPLTSFLFGESVSLFWICRVYLYVSTCIYYILAQNWCICIWFANQAQSLRSFASSKDSIDAGARFLRLCAWSATRICGLKSVYARFCWKVTTIQWLVLIHL